MASPGLPTAGLRAPILMRKSTGSVTTIRCQPSTRSCVDFYSNALRLPIIWNPDQSRNRNIGSERKSAGCLVTLTLPAAFSVDTMRNCTCPEPVSAVLHLSPPVPSRHGRDGIPAPAACPCPHTPATGMRHRASRRSRASRPSSVTVPRPHNAGAMSIEHILSCVCRSWPTASLNFTAGSWRLSSAPS